MTCDPLHNIHSLQHALPREGQASHSEPRQAGGGHKGGRRTLLLTSHLQDPLHPTCWWPSPRTLGVQTIDNWHHHHLYCHLPRGDIDQIWTEEVQVPWKPLLAKDLHIIYNFRLLEEWRYVQHCNCRQDLHREWAGEADLHACRDPREGRRTRAGATKIIQELLVETCSSVERTEKV